MGLLDRIKDKIQDKPISEEVHSRMREALFQNLKAKLKKLHLSHANSSTPIRSSPEPNAFCEALDLVLSHGVKVPWYTIDTTFWPIACELSHKNTIDDIKKLKKASSDKTRVRAWIRLAINENSMESYINALSLNSTWLTEYFEPYAFMRDEEQRMKLKALLASVSFTATFSLNIDDPALEQDPYPINLDLYSHPLSSMGPTTTTTVTTSTSSSSSSSTFQQVNSSLTMTSSSMSADLPSSSSSLKPPTNSTTSATTKTSSRSEPPLVSFIQPVRQYTKKKKRKKKSKEGDIFSASLQVEDDEGEPGIKADDSDNANFAEDALFTEELNVPDDVKEDENFVGEEKVTPKQHDMKQEKSDNGHELREDDQETLTQQQVQQQELHQQAVQPDIVPRDIIPRKDIQQHSAEQEIDHLPTTQELPKQQCVGDMSKNSEERLESYKKDGSKEGEPIATKETQHLLSNDQTTDIEIQNHTPQAAVQETPNEESKASQEKNETIRKDGEEPINKNEEDTTVEDVSSGDKEDMIKIDEDETTTTESEEDSVCHDDAKGTQQVEEAEKVTTNSAVNETVNNALRAADEILLKLQSTGEKKNGDDLDAKEDNQVQTPTGHNTKGFDERVACEEENRVTMPSTDNATPDVVGNVPELCTLAGRTKPVVQQSRKDVDVDANLAGDEPTFDFLSMNDVKEIMNEGADSNKPSDSAPTHANSANFTESATKSISGIVKLPAYKQHNRNPSLDTNPCELESSLDTFTLDSETEEEDAVTNSLNTTTESVSVFDQMMQEELSTIQTDPAHPLNRTEESGFADTNQKVQSTPTSVPISEPTTPTTHKSRSRFASFSSTSSSKSHTPTKPQAPTTPKHLIRYSYVTDNGMKEARAGSPSRVDKQKAMEKLFGVERNVLDFPEVNGHKFVITTIPPRQERPCEVCNRPLKVLIMSSRPMECIKCHLWVHKRCHTNVPRLCVSLNHPLTSVITDICPNKGLFAQNYKCAGCFADVGFHSMFDTPKLCDYTGRYYCSACHVDGKSIIPARVVKSWDFMEMPVSVVSKDVLLATYDKPILNISQLNPSLFNHVELMHELKKWRFILRQMATFISNCRFAREETLLAPLRQHFHFIDQEAMDWYSLRDLVDLKDGVLLPVITKVVEACNTHITSKCQLCQAQGHVCECCNDKRVIYHFQKNVHRCSNCHRAFHFECFKKARECPFCARMLRRSQSGKANPTNIFEPSSINTGENGMF
eukprot:m.33664 g.33664  ORF g.33664 m.33664 type:complete len:1234 (-) comp6465_c0_seq1:2610-6311(-)